MRLQLEVDYNRRTLEVRLAKCSCGKWRMRGVSRDAVFGLWGIHCDQEHRSVRVVDSVSDG